VLGAAVVAAAIAFGTFFTPGMTLVSNVAEERGLQFRYSSSLLNIAWAPGQTLGAAGGAALAQLTTDAVPYLLLSGVCAVTLAAVRRRTI
jgi:integral membrane sensor domain MASE1